ncbi:uclacyanin 1-like [Salvia miltiorrhiza]|uniref:uclacyanin 1-like n=1 Tax=Salvia miltiorrhiza TaxID=226208 RepID=UPI0025AC4963|nr:uclacyanin 1-like [Salvia miltiorrhiza]
MEATRLNMFVFLSLVAAAMLHGSSAQTTHVVGDALGWLVPPGGDVAYRTWAATQTFTVGDVLVFNFTADAHNVAEVSKEAFDSCNTTNPISLSTTSPTNITLTSAGEHHFLCTFQSHCDFGQKLAINVTAASAAPAPQPATPPPAATPSPEAEVYTVGDALGWLVPPGGPIAYQTWARNKAFVVGDILVFNFTNAAHNVLQVTKAEFDSCNVSTTTTPPTTASPARITLTSAGEHYYMCTFPQHCSFGQKLAINVTGSSGGAPAPAPSSPAPTPSSPPTPPPSSATPPSSSATPPTSAATPPTSAATPPTSAGGPSSSTPSTPATPSPRTPPPPPSGSSASVAAAALPITLLAVALAFLCN